MIGWIRARGATEISREEVRREALSQRVNAAGADEVILALEQAGVLREVDDEEEYPSRGRPARRWQVNPALLAKPAAQIAEIPFDGPQAPVLSEAEGSRPAHDSSGPRASGSLMSERDARGPEEAGLEVHNSIDTEPSHVLDAPPRVPAPVQAEWPK